MIGCGIVVLVVNLLPERWTVRVAGATTVTNGKSLCCQMSSIVKEFETLTMPMQRTQVHGVLPTMLEHATNLLAVRTRQTENPMSEVGPSDCVVYAKESACMQL